MQCNSLNNSLLFILFLVSSVLQRQMFAFFSLTLYRYVWNAPYISCFGLTTSKFIIQPQELSSTPFCLPKLTRKGGNQMREKTHMWGSIWAKCLGTVWKKCTFPIALRGSDSHRNNRVGSWKNARENVSYELGKVKYCFQHLMNYTKSYMDIWTHQEQVLLDARPWESNNSKTKITGNLKRILILNDLDFRRKKKKKDCLENLKL